MFVEAWYPLDDTGTEEVLLGRNPTILGILVYPPKALSERKEETACQSRLSRLLVETYSYSAP